MRWVMLSGLFLLSVAFSSFYATSDPYPQGYFDWPVKHAVSLSATFGELRPDHFHAGLDIRSSKGAAGDPLYAAAEGYVSRVRVYGRGYGKALYIAHPNGYTTVYGHLDQFTDEVEAYIKNEQYSRRSFEVDLYLPAGLFSFQKGQYIGKMGNSGSSRGAHLHFEVRESANDKALNPLLFGFPLLDDMAPKLFSLKVLKMDGLGIHEAKTQTITLGFDGGYYHPEPETLTVNTPFAAFALKAYDQHDSPSNRNGIYSMEMKVDGKPDFKFVLDGVLFEDTRYVNAHMDYEEQVSKRGYFHRCFRLPGNQLPIYPVEANQGIVSLEPGEVKLLEIEVSDPFENTSRLRFWIRRKGEERLPLPGPFQYYVYQDRDNLVQTKDCSLIIPRGTVYEDLPLQFRKASAKGLGYLSDVFHIHDYFTPAHAYFNLSIKGNEEEKAFIAYFDAKGRIQNCGGVWQDGSLSAPVRQFGAYAILVDREAPTVTPSYFRYDMRKRSSMSFKIIDNYRTASNLGGMRYHATVDGEWILMEYDGKSDRIIHRFDERIPPGEHRLRLEVSDVLGNETVLEMDFIR